MPQLPKIKTILFFLTVIIFAANCYAGKIKILDENKNISDTIPIFDENNKPHTFDEFEGKTILLVFWATWCGPCQQEMGELDILQKDFRKLPFEIIAASQDYTGIKKVDEYYKKRKIKYLKIYHDYQNELFKSTESTGIPTSYLISTEGKILVKLAGNINWYDEEVRKLLISYIPGSHPEPKNSHKEQLLGPQLNNQIEEEKANEEAASKKDLKQELDKKEEKDNNMQSNPKQEEKEDVNKAI